jgi:hypothetical protein
MIRIVAAWQCARVSSQFLAPDLRGHDFLFLPVSRVNCFTTLINMKFSIYALTEICSLLSYLDVVKSSGMLNALAKENEGFSPTNLNKRRTKIQN